jgi:prepilin-type N-terminal cleavage/methylation domain-containing protein
VKNKSRIKMKQGFTIIEVVLVLAIAGLIFLMVFLALPTLQRNQRDTQRKNDLNRVGAQTQSYSSNNQGRIPSNTQDQAGAWNTFRLSYLNSPDPFLDPDGEPYVLVYAGVPASGSGSAVWEFGDMATVSGVTGHQIRVYTQAACNGENAEKIENGTRRVAFRMKLEGAGISCVDNGA